MRYYGEDLGERFIWYVEGCQRQQDAIEAGGPRSEYRSLIDPTEVELEPIIHETSTWTLEDQQQGYAEWHAAASALFASVRAEKAQKS